MRVVGVEAGGDVLPVVCERRPQLLLGGHQHGGVLAHQLEEGAEVVHGQHLCDVGPLCIRLRGRHLGELPVPGVELGRGCDLHTLRVLEGALGEGGEPAQRLHLVAEQLDAHRALLGGRVDVEDAAADGELPALDDLFLPFVAARDQPLERLVEVEVLPDGDREAVWAQVRVGDPLHQRDGARHHDRRLARGRLEQRVECCDAQADQVGSGGEVRLVPDPAGRIEAHGSGRQEGAQVERQVTGHAVVGGDDQRRAVAEPRRLEQRGDQERPQGGRRERPLRRPGRRLREALDVIVLKGSM